MFNSQFEVLGNFDAKEVEPWLQDVDAKPEFAGIVKDCRQLRKIMKAQESVRLNHPVPDMLSTLPSQAVCDVLVDAYLRTFEPAHLPGYSYPIFLGRVSPVLGPAGVDIDPFPDEACHDPCAGYHILPRSK